MSEHASDKFEVSEDDRKEYRKYLHLKGRAECLDGIESHLNSASRLARAIWEMAGSYDLCDDERTRLALLELANCAADHASAALYSFLVGAVVEREFFEMQCAKAREAGFRAGLEAGRRKAEAAPVCARPVAE